MGKSLEGQRFGRLFVLRYFDSVPNDKGKKRRRWLCLCDCGKEKIAITSYLTSENTKSCGCLGIEVKKRNGKNLIASNKARWTGCGEISGTYWSHLKQGALDRRIPFGITIEYSWRLFLRQKRLCALSGRVLCFKSRDTGQDDRTATASLDRIDNSKGYVPRNVQWLHKDVNRLKHTFSQKEFIEMCVEVSKNFE
jgi:hypothetical protein